jgi:uncharacterized membrane protein
MTVKNTSVYLLALIFIIFSFVPYNPKSLYCLVVGLCFLVAALYGSIKSN